MRYILKQKPQMNTEKEAVARLRKELKLSQITASLLCARGLSDTAAAYDFLNPGVSQLHDPFSFLDMRDAVSAIKHAIASKKRICVYGDYDADGISASAILYKTLVQMGGQVEVFLPNRMEHGYGLTMDNVKSLQGISLLITVDCGITSIDEIEQAKKMGMTTILTDHHECPPVLPQADYILNPHRPGETYPFDSLCGAGVAFKLAQALIGDAALEMIDLAALATIADIVPLLGENRSISALGLKRLNEEPNPGVAALVQKACTKRNAEIDAQTVSFVLAPRINAAGRISTAKTAFELLTGNDEEKLNDLAEQLCALNADRQQRQEKVVSEAVRMYTESGDPSASIIILYQKDWDIGIVGLAASKIAEAYMRPTILLGETEPGLYTGSARSIPGINIYEAMRSQAKLYEKFGGHAGAAGLTVKEEYIPQIARRLDGYLKQAYKEDVFRPLKTYDFEIVPAEINNALISELERLRPFGFKNEQVELLVRGARLENIRSIGEDRHAKFKISKQGREINAVVFGTSASELPKQADIVGTVSVNTYDMKPQMVVSVLSYEDTLLQRLQKAKKYLERMTAPAVSDRQIYFVPRSLLLEIYAVLKGAAERKITFSDEADVAAFIQKYAPVTEPERIVFALTVFREIGLLEMKKNDRIHIVIYTGKRELSNSRLYKMFTSGEM